MIGNSYRFHGHGSLRYVYRNGRNVRSRWVAARFIDNPRRSKPRFAVVISKKVFKSAVKRNRIRRRVYEIVRANITENSPNIDIVLTIYSPEVLDAPGVELTRQITQILRETGFIRRQTDEIMV